MLWTGDRLQKGTERATVPPELREAELSPLQFLSFFRSTSRVEICCLQTTNELQALLTRLDMEPTEARC